MPASVLGMKFGNLTKIYGFQTLHADNDVQKDKNIQRT